MLPVVAAAGCSNLTIAALDNGTFGSTGNQMSPAYATADLGFLALGAGIARRTQFVHVLLSPGNSASPNIPLSPAEIRDRFMLFCKK